MPEGDALTILAPMLRVRPEMQDLCLLGGDWRLDHEPETPGWAAFHMVVSGSCRVERPGQPPVELDGGDLLLLPHGDPHKVRGGTGQRAMADLKVTDRGYIRLKETPGTEVETELVCGRLNLDSPGQLLLLPTLPHEIVLRAGNLQHWAGLILMIRDELRIEGAGAAAIAADLASALFVMLLRRHFETEPPAGGLLALLSNAATRKAVAAMLAEPARDWGLDELAAIAALSRATLVRSFRRLAGTSPQAFLTELRLEMARRRIMETAESLGQIAEQVGYQSEAALSRALHRRYAIRPGALRRGAEASA